jgi:hypothetical protein
VRLHELEAFGSLDWGFNSPGCLLIWLCLMDGHYHVVAELKFRQKSAETVAEEIKALIRELGVKLRYIACDPSMKAKTGHGKGEAIMETLQRRGLPMRPSDNDRINGWLRVHELLQMAPDGTPWLTVEPTCKYLIRSLPAQMSDKRNPEDIDTGGDDHAADALRYGAMSRPSPTRQMLKEKKLHPMLEEAIAGSSSHSGVLGSTNVRSRVA